jgi:purine-binding chemotaxis protein CheW
MTNEGELKFLVYRIGSEMFASPLLSIREVLEFQTPKPMPNMTPSFSGVVNVRGAIVGVIDLRHKFQQKVSNGSRTPFLLCQTERGTIAAVVDSVEKVQEFVEDQIERRPPISTKVEQNFLIGVAKDGGHLITLVDIDKLLNDQEYKNVSGEAK